MRRIFGRATEHLHMLSLHCCCCCCLLTVVQRGDTVSLRAKFTPPDFDDCSFAVLRSTPGGG
jgi:hypothetical protein